MSKNVREVELDLNLIVFDDELKVRVETDPDTIRDYYDAMETEEDLKKFPKPTVYFDGHRYWLADGHHRYWAAKRRGFTKITVKVIDGSHDEAILAAVKLNLNHGLRFNEGDWERIISLVAAKDQWKDWTNRKLAEELNCSYETVRRYRPDSVDTGVSTEKRRGKDGKMYKATKAKKPKSAVTEQKQSEPIVAECKKSIIEASTPDFIEADVPEAITDTETSPVESPSPDQHRVDLNTKQTQIDETISLLETQLIEWLELILPEEGDAFKQEIGNRLHALVDDLMNDVPS